MKLNKNVKIDSTENHLFISEECPYWLDTLNVFLLFSNQSPFEYGINPTFQSHPQQFFTTPLSFHSMYTAHGYPMLPKEALHIFVLVQVIDDSATTYFPMEILIPFSTHPNFSSHQVLM